MIAVVIDTGVLISAIGWRGPAHRCLALVARRQCRMVVSTDIMAEYDLRVPAVLAQEAPQTNARGALAWLRAKALWVEPAPLGRQRSRDLKDEKFLAAALSANAKATLLVAKAEIDAKDKVHVTPLYWAAEIGDTNMTKIGPLGPFGLAGSAPATVHLSEKLLEQRSPLRRKRGHQPNILMDRHLSEAAKKNAPLHI